MAVAGHVTLRVQRARRDPLAHPPPSADPRAKATRLLFRARSHRGALGLQRREAFANDLAHPGSLIAVTASSNRSKSDGDPASWVPSNGAYRCEYLARWVEVKVRWELSVDPTEHDVISTGLTDCPANYASPATPPPPPPATGTPPDSQVSPAPGGVPWYANCSEVRAAGAAPITADNPGFRSAFDRDDDGVGCE